MGNLGKRFEMVVVMSAILLTGVAGKNFSATALLIDLFRKM